MALHGSQVGFRRMNVRGKHDVASSLVPGPGSAKAHGPVRMYIFFFFELRFIVLAILATRLVRVPSSALPSLCSSAHSNANFDSDDTRTALYTLAATRLLRNMSTLQKSPFPSRRPSLQILGLANDDEDFNEDLVSRCKCTG